MSSTTSNPKLYFDIHTSGIGYIQRVREVPVKGGRKATSFLACTVAALVGPAQNPTRRYFDVRVSGAEAKQLVQPYIGIDDPQQRPLVRFHLGDLWIDPFRRPLGDPAASMKARLLKAELLDRSALDEIEYHELLTRGIGYLNSPRMIPNGGDPFLSCSIAALAGPVDDPEYRYIETTVADDSAQHLVQRCIQAVETKKKVLLAFTLNDMKAEAYVRSKGEHAGEVGGSLKSKLMRIGLIKVDGVQVYPLESAAPAHEDAPSSDETVHAEDDNGGPQPTAPTQAPVEEPARVASF
ncbi:DUF3577 domain-containing protein [Pseudomonas sp. D(2018)]|uniref:DUF3577 domain-containing protein n=1 Tax=Pseudomonas sp. D(2018) TaxID=2502238 RepID=UPI0010F51A91|nr:DUF3577 domain-containing protein [Pseudomonas sp. D(2018)]